MAIAAMACLAFAEPSFAQAEQARQWLADLSIVAEMPSTIPAAARQPRVAAVRRELDAWIALNPDRAVVVPTPPAGVWTDDQLREQIRILTQALEGLLRSDPNRPFYLGITAVNVTAPGMVLSPVSDRLDQREIRNRQALTVNQAIEYLPGVSIDHKAPRNQTGISIGGFDGRQVPLYLDGTPAYVPFDGYVDLTRYLTSDVAEIQVARGHSSPLLGPNVMGGVINLVTRQPQKRIEGDTLIGAGAGGLLNAGVHVGSRWRSGFAQASADRLHSEFFPISGAFASNARQPGDRRTNSSQQDDRYRARAGWTPRGRDSYVVSYESQRGVNDVPPYSGTAPACPSGAATATAPCVTPKYWRWPEWNVDSVYLNTRTALGSAGSLQLRAFHARYANTMAMFDDAAYSTMSLPSSGTIDNRDRTSGMSGQFDPPRLGRHALAASFFVKRDTHAEQAATFSTAGVPTDTPAQTHRDRQSSFGVQDTIAVSSRLTATAGISADALDGLEAQDLSADRTRIVPFQVAGVCTPASSTSFDSCTDHQWAYNPVGSIAYSAGGAGTAFVTFAHKSRFPTLKDRYSYRAGRALPNPLLHPERAETWTAGYSRSFARGTVVQADGFHSDVSDGIANIFFLSPLCSGGGRGGAGSCQQAVNLGSETRAGVNLALRSTPVARVTVDANYGYLHRRMGGTTTAFPTGTPVHKAMGAATIRLPRGAAGLMSARYQSGTVGMSDNGLPLPANAFTTIDLGGTLPLRAGVSVQAGVKNVFDRNYYYWEGYPEAGRHAYVTLRYVF